MVNIYICPVCGYRMRYPPSDFHICPSCGTEFGYDDAGRSHEDLRAIWLRSGAHWWSSAEPPPPNWDAYTQLNTLFFSSLLPTQLSTSQGSTSGLGPALGATTRQSPPLLGYANSPINQGPPPDSGWRTAA